ncbi:SCO family protein [Yoonia sp. R2331]|uniref:SCO family protein n=1 Tax=Yoonia sp. R2331 TaxID=3237238 RepID=UPI0034E4A9FD
MIRMISVAASVAVLGVLGTTYVLTQRTPAGCGGGVVAGGDFGGPFTLVDGSGATLTDADVITEPTLIYFGYTFCPDVCPIDNARNAAAVDILAEQGIDATPVFISIDPARDTPQVVGDYIQNFHPEMIGLTGSDEQIKAAAGAYRVVYSQADDDPDYYLMNHSVFTYFVTPEDGFVDFFRREDGPEALADRVACHVAQS